MSELLNINVNEHTEKKNGLTYLSWAWAWAEVLKVDPQATWEAQEFDGFPASFAPDGSAMVKVMVTIKAHTKTCWLPVMNHANKAIKNPDAFAINTAIVRCLTKCIGMFGLGLYIYAGEDLPESESDAKPANVRAVRVNATDGAAEALDAQEREAMEEVAMYLVDAHKDGRDMDAIRVWYDPATFSSNEQKVYVWSLLKAESKLRATIKANRPALEAA